MPQGVDRDTGVVVSDDSEKDASASTLDTGAGEVPPTAERVRDAWMRRQCSFISFWCECSVEDRFVQYRTPADPFAAPTKGKDELLNRDEVERITLTYSVQENGKMAYDEKRLSWNVQASEMCEDHFSATFDGAESRLLMDNSLLDKADKPCLGELIIDMAPHDAATCSARQTAFWFAFNPLAWLERQAYQLDSMRIIDTRSVFNGHNCLRISVLCKNPAWESWVYADPARDFIPVRFASRLDGVVRSNLEIEYTPDAAVGWRLSSWKTDSFDQSGAVERRSTGTVTAARINTLLDDNISSARFPAGMHVVERRGGERKFFVVTENGARRYITEADFGRGESRKQ